MLVSCQFKGMENFAEQLKKLQLPPCSNQASKKHKKSLSLTTIIISGCAAVVSLFLLSCLLAIRCRLKNSSKKSPSICSMGEHFLEVTFAELFKATEGFSSANLIGVGSFGFVYKGFLEQLDKLLQ